MKILATERNLNSETPLAFVKAGHDFFAPKEEIPGVHEFDHSALIQTIKDLKPDILMVGLKFQIDKEILDLGVKAVFTRTTGLDHIDTEYAKEKGIEVLSLRGEDLSEIVATAEWTFLNMGMLLRKTGHELKGKNLGLIGSRGRIASLMDRYAVAFKMNIYYYDKDDSPERLNELFAQSDIVSLHITADENNRNWMDIGKFSHMKRGSWFLNSSRDWLVDKSGLAWALASGVLAGAWSDFPEHQGGKTMESSIATEKIIVQKIFDYAKGKI